MSFDLIPRQSFLRLPTLWEDDDDWLTPTPANTSGVSVSEDDKNVFVTAAVPGVDEKDIDVTFDKGFIWIKGETKQEEQDKKRKYYRRSSNSFSYRVAVPGDLDLSVEPEATYKNGVMTVRFTKSPAVQPKKISVKSGK